jgi:hypothetical protein
MSKAAIEYQQEFSRSPATRLGRCVPGVAVRLGIASVALVAGIFPVAARSPQIQSFHPLFPPRPLTRSVSAPPAIKPANLPAKRKGKLTPKERKRIAEAMNSRKAPPAQKSVR